MDSPVPSTSKGEVMEIPMASQTSRRGPGETMIEKPKPQRELRGTNRSQKRTRSERKTHSNPEDTDSESGRVNKTRVVEGKDEDERPLSSDATEAIDAEEDI